ncbi:MAG: hypothetical protein IJR58_03115 [Lachnospiraceae bacterium]|nr:hypothetical protein [Lachnospiraceae bacterium]
MSKQNINKMMESLTALFNENGYYVESFDENQCVFATDDHSICITLKNTFPGFFFYDTAMRRSFRISLEPDAKDQEQSIISMKQRVLQSKNVETFIERIRPVLEYLFLLTRQVQSNDVEDYPSIESEYKLYSKYKEFEKEFHSLFPDFIFIDKEERVNRIITFVKRIQGTIDRESLLFVLAAGMGYYKRNKESLSYDWTPQNHCVLVTKEGEVKDMPLVKAYAVIQSTCENELRMMLQSEL